MYEVDDTRSLNKFQRSTSFPEKNILQNSVFYDNNYSMMNISNHEKMLKIIEAFEDGENAYNTSRNKKSLTEIYELDMRYRILFNSVARKTEKWASLRRMLIKQIEESMAALNRMKLNVCIGKLVFSTADVVGTTCALILGHLDSKWAKPALYTAGSLGCFSFICSLVEITKTTSIMEDILKNLRKDSDSLMDIQRLLVNMSDFDKSAKALFPHGIDLRIVRLIQNPSAAKYNKNPDINETITSTKLHTHIALAVLMSNTRIDPKLLEDKEFLTKVQLFSNSPVAEKWWTRMKYQAQLPISLKTRLFTQMNSMSRIQSMPIITFPLLSSPVWHLNGFPTAGSLVLNTMVAFDAYCEIIQNGKTRESDTLTELKYVLETEYKKVMDIYDKLSPYDS